MRTSTEAPLPAITWPILVFVIATWALIGLVAWIPLLIRCVAVFSTTLLAASFVGTRPNGAESALRFALNFYPRGFVVVLDTFRRMQSGDGEDTARESISWLRVAKELVFSIVFWWSAVHIWQGTFTDDLLQLVRAFQEFLNQK
jgi:hypothetical protein